MANKGQFKKGDPRAGRKTGAKNVRTSQWEALVETLEGSQAKSFEAFMATMWSGTKSDKLAAAKLYLQLLEFHKPKLQRTSLTGSDGDAIEIEFK